MKAVLRIQLWFLEAIDSAKKGRPRSKSPKKTEKTAGSKKPVDSDSDSGAISDDEGSDSDKDSKPKKGQHSDIPVTWTSPRKVSVWKQICDSAI